jgi:thioredoxin 1
MNNTPLDWKDPMIASIGEKAFKEEVLNSPVPVFVNFWAPWCGPCKMVEPWVLQLKDTATKPVKVFRVNADENFWLAKNFRLTNIPTVLLFHRGKVVHRLEHVQGREEVLQTLKTALDSIRQDETPTQNSSPLQTFSIPH